MRQRTQPDTRFVEAMTDGRFLLRTKMRFRRVRHGRGLNLEFVLSIEWLLRMSVQGLA
jgi:hypothetical protein